jgi:hypothetical protein
MRVRLENHTEGGTGWYGGVPGATRGTERSGR